MIKLSGYEATALGFLARFPKSAEARKKLDTLTGHAYSIGTSILDPTADVSPSNYSAARGIQAWADEPSTRPVPCKTCGKI